MVLFLVAANLPQYALANSLGGWNARNPVPTSSNLYGSAYGNGIYAAVGESGTIVTSSDGVNWTSRASGTINTLYSIAYGNGMFVTVGGGGTILTSSNGVNWTDRSGITSNVLGGIIYGNGLFVAVGTGGAIVTSANGTSWSNRTSGVTESLNSVIYGNSIFIAVGNKGKIVTSTNGTSWTSRTSGVTDALNGVTYGNSTFVTVGGGGTILTSTNGTSWTSRTSGTTSTLYNVTYGNGTFMATDYISNKILASSNGSSWASRTTSTTNVLNGISYVNSMYMAVGGGGIIVTSGNGTSWTNRTSPITNNLTSVIYGNSGYVAVGNGIIMTSGNGTSWTSQASGTTNALNGVAFGNSKYVTVGNGGVIMTSSNGISWAGQTSGTTNALNGVTFGNGVYVAAGNNGTIVTSSDGVNWTSQTSGTSNPLYSVTYGNGVYVAVGSLGVIVTSSNGVNWTLQTSNTTNTLYGVTFGNGVYVAVGTSGAIAISSDGASWSSLASGTYDTLRNVMYGNGMYVASGNLGTMRISSSDGLNWLSQASGTSKGLYGSVYAKGTYMTVGLSGTIMQTDLLPVTTYTVTYSGNGATSGSLPADNGLYEQGELVTVLGNTGSLARTDFTFAGWNTEADGSGTDYAPGTDFMMGTGNVTLYANWTANPPVPAVNSVSVSPDTASVEQGSSKQLAATVDTVGGAATTVTWTSNDVSHKVTVDGTGKVTVAADATPGDYTITATSTVDSSKKGIATITVTAAPAVIGVSVSPNTASVEQGSSKQLAATVDTVGGAATTVTWTSNDASHKVTVDGTGKVTVTADAAPGDYTITATSTVDSSKKGTATITVTAAPAVIGVSVSPNTASVEQGSSKQLAATVDTVGGAATTVTWTSNDVSHKVTVDGTGKVIVAADATPGDYTITATSTVDSSKKGTATITVTAAPAVIGVSVSPNTASVEQGSSKQLAATVDTVGGAATTVTWTSNDASHKVTVDSTGKVTVAADATPGDYTITATSTVDSSKKGTATITVTAAPAVNSVSVSPDTASVEQGSSKQLAATVDAVGGAATTVTWTSNDASHKVTVDSTGKVTVAADATPGDYTITATSTVDSSKKGTATITVTAAPAVNSVSVSPDTASVEQGSSKQLAATVDAVGGAATTVTWTNNDASHKVTVDSTGKVTVAADATPGDYTITATSTVDSSKKGTATITVTAAPAVNSVSVSPDTASVEQGSSKQLAATVDAVGGAATTVTWTSNDASNKVTVDGTGKVTVAADATPGDYTITATSTVDSSKKGTATITVTAAPAVIGVSVSPNTASVEQGSSKQLAATVDTVGGAVTTVTWTSNDASHKVTVDGTGKVTVTADAAPGDYTITATSTVDSSKKGTATITVTAAPAVNSVSVSPDTASVEQGSSKQLAATVDTVGGAATTVTWTSNDASHKVTVDGTGKVTVAADAAPGDYTITATSTVDSSKKGTATITVTAAPAVIGVSVSPNTASVEQGSSKQLAATVDTVGGAATAVTWTSNDASHKVTVDGTGKVTVAADAAPGDYTITATSTVDSSKKGTATITVTEAPVYTIAAISNQTLTALAEGYATGTQETKPISVTNTGTGQLTNLTVTISGTNPNDYTITQPASSLNSSESTSFTIQAKDGLAAGTYSATVTVSADLMTPVTFTVTQSVNLPDAPANPQELNAVGGNRQVTLNWSTVAGATYYNIYMATASGQYTDDEVATVTASTYNVEDLVNGTTYYFVVKAGNAGGLGAKSNEASATPAIAPAAPTNVTATAGDGQVTLTFTAPADDGGSPITRYEVTVVPGNVVVSGTSSTIVVTGLSNGTSYTFTVKAINAAGVSVSSAESNPVVPKSSSPTVPTTPNTVNNSVDVLINGKVENAGTATTSKRNDQNVITISVDQKKLEDKLAAEGQGAVITIPVNSKSDIVIGELNGQMVKSMENKQAVVVIKTDQATYTIPAQQIQIGAIADKWGNTVSLQDIKVQIEIASPTADTLKVVENAAANGMFTLVVPPVGFTIKATYGNESIEISKFNVYVERTLPIPAGVDPSKITTGVVVEPDGTVRHVPTKIVLIDGMYYAQINSLTNSTYSIVWHPLEFLDVANHWAKAAINDMGSRMVINGTGDGLFSPDRDITRAEFAAILVRGLGLKPENRSSAFSDVNASDWFSSAINTAYVYQLINGFEDGTFRPNDRITREEAMTMLSRAMAITGLKATLSDQSEAAILYPFGDASNVSDWAIGGAADSIQAGLVTGRSAAELAPKAFITRAEVATIIQRLLQASELI
ncbi:Ig-like domain-containing protein [Paenibacillus sp. JDR-2]|uniref:Ig-like domain-containing protein n=1 Tax=Paenibacillus sp. (strain JDR-2) TaxID=324057 RepID=UPI0006740349|nr:Ig-like domain-containing protein [Paenibacillus sp. JDR-2]